MSKEFLDLPNLRVLKAKLPDDLYNKILNECLQCEKNNKKFDTGLTATGTPNHYKLKDTTNDLFNFLSPLIDEWFKKHPNYVKQSYSILDEDCPFHLTEPWINLQEKNKFLPIHTHDGILSYSIWIKIPYEKSNKKFYSFQFVYNNIIGLNNTHDFQLGKKDEGTILIFPSLLNHIVFPFYSSKEKRISVSGNLIIKVK